MTFSDLARRAAKAAIDNSPHILSGLAIAGAVTTAWLSGKAAFEAADIIRLKEADDEERGVLVPSPKELMKERIQLVFPLFVPPILMGAATVACIIGADRVSASRAAGIATAYTLLERNHGDLKSKIVEKFGEKKAGDTQDEIVADRIRQHESETLLEEPALMGLSEGLLCYDLYADQFFKSTPELIRTAMNDLNHAMLNNGTACLGDFYQFLGRDRPPFSESVGWNADRLMDLYIGADLMHGLPVVTMRFVHDPQTDNSRFR